MRAPGFLQLVKIDERRFITACRHGLVHVTWERTTIRFSRDEFRRLVGLLQRSADALPPSLIHEGEMRITCRLDEECELQIGSLSLLLSPSEFLELAKGAREAVRRLDQILASGVWDRGEEEDTPPGLLELLRRFSFSKN